jgi:hypothetical protein
MIDQGLFSAASSDLAGPPQTWEHPSFAMLVSTAGPGDSCPLAQESANEVGWAFSSPARRDEAPGCEVRSRVCLVPEHGGEQVQHRVLLATGCKATATRVRRILEGSDWKVVVASGKVELLLILRRAIKSGSFGGYVLVEDTWIEGAAGGALLEAARCAAPRERIVRLATGREVEARDGDERALQQPVRRAELEALLGIGTARDRSLAWAPAGSVLERSLWIDEVWGVSRFEGDHDLWLNNLAHFAARYESLPWRLGVELRENGAEDVAESVCRIADAAATLGLRRLSSALRLVSEGVDDSAMRRCRIDDLLRVHSQTFASVRTLLADEGISGLGGPLDQVDPFRAA